MTTKTHLRSLAVVVSAACLVTGCSKSSKTPSAAGAATQGAAGAATQGAAGAATQGAAASTGAGQAAAGGSAPAGAAAALAGATGAGGPLDQSKQCAAIKPADVQALMKAPVSAVVNYPGECSFYGGDLKIDIYANDPTQKYYQNPVNGPGTTPLTGIGDQAQWFAPVAGATTPWVEAHKGSMTCTISPADPPATTLPYTGSDPFYKIAPADSAAYAAKEGALCNDVFSAS